MHPWLLLVLLCISGLFISPVRSRPLHRFFANTGSRTKEERILEWMSNYPGQKLTKNLKDCSMFGRVPCDDWLFSSRRLADPHLLKKTFSEEILQELEIARRFHRQNQLIPFMKSVIDTLSYYSLMTGLAYLTWRAVDSKHEPVAEGRSVDPARLLPFGVRAVRRTKSQHNSPDDGSDTDS